MNRILIFALAGGLLFPLLSTARESNLLPSRKAALVLTLLKQFSAKDGYLKIEEILGKPDMDVGSGIYVYVFHLEDASSIFVGTADHQSVLYIHRTGHGVDGEQVIYKKDKT